MKKQVASKSDDREPKPSSSKTSEESEAAGTSGATKSIDFGDANQYVEVSPIGTGELLQTFLTRANCQY